MQNFNKKIYPEDTQKLRDFMYNLPYCEYNATREKLVAACKIPSHTFTNWLQGNCRIPALAKDRINEVLNITIF